VINASSNWWGDAAGPYSADNYYAAVNGVPGPDIRTTGDMAIGTVTGNVTTVPWLNSGVDGNLITPGFQPTTSADTTVPVLAGGTITVNEGSRVNLPVTDAVSGTGLWHIEPLDWGDGTVQSDFYANISTLSHVYLGHYAQPLVVTAVIDDGAGNSNYATNTTFHVVVLNSPAVITITSPALNTTITEGGSITEGIGLARGTAIVEQMKVDKAYLIPDEEAVPIIFDLLEHEGLCLGGSSGINVAGAIRLAKELGPGHTIVTILCDYGTRYQSKLYNPEFLKEHNLPVPAWLTARTELKVPFAGTAT